VKAATTEFLKRTEFYSSTSIAMSKSASIVLDHAHYSHPSDSHKKKNPGIPKVPPEGNEKKRAFLPALPK
jgi:hypothetical protein